jgi:ABC-2 type transport system permease protein
MFSKPLFKQSIKANGLSWLVVTTLVCFMLACVMTISGSGSVGDIESGVTDTIITKEIEAAANKQALSYYGYSVEVEGEFDDSFSENFQEEETSSSSYYQNVAVWMNTVSKNAFSVPELKENQASMPSPTDELSSSKSLQTLFLKWINEEPSTSDYDLTTSAGQGQYSTAVTSWQAAIPSTSLVGSLSATGAYVSAIDDATTYCLTLAQKTDSTATTDSSSYKEIYGSFMVTLDPNGATDEYYTNHSLDVPASYDVSSIVTHTLAGDYSSYKTSDERVNYLRSRAQTGVSVFLGDLFEQDSVKASLITALSEYGVSEEKYDSYGYNFPKINDLANNSIASYIARYDYEKGQIDNKEESGEYATEADYQAALTSMDTSLKADLGSSFLSNLPSDVSSALEEVGKMDVYSLIVGSVYFKMAGLLLPIIYIIMTANNLISSQVDSGSMAYVLATGTKRSTVIFTQALYLVGSILAMSVASMVTSFICFSCVSIANTSMTYGSLALMSLCSFATLFAFAGINFFTSCLFSREKRSMAIGGGLSIFALVATMLGLFGSKEIPSIVRFSSLNYFNYFSIISLFDVPSIVDGTTTYIWKMVILFVIGLIGFGVGENVFKKKDLPL